MKLIKLASLPLALPLAFLIGCAAQSSEAGDQAAADEELGDSAETATDVVASADVGYGEVFFHESIQADGSVAIAISERTANDVGWTPLQAAMAAHTNLEVFLKLVPDQEPPQSYVDAHSAQTVELGRANADVVVAEFDAEAPVEKTSQACKDFITPATNGCDTYTYSGIVENNNRYGASAQSLTLAATSSNTTMGICNDGTGPVQGRVGYALASTPFLFSYSGWSSNLAPGGMWKWFGYRVLAPCGSGFCVPQNLEILPRVQGRSMTLFSSNTYDLRGARVSTQSCNPPPVIR